MATKLNICRWRIMQLDEHLHAVGTVEAPDLDAAIKIAIEKFEITDKEEQKRLIAVLT
jgi:hypothetical protein